MKKILVILSACIALGACGQSDEQVVYDYFYKMYYCDDLKKDKTSYAYQFFCVEKIHQNIAELKSDNRLEACAYLVRHGQDC
ncbi:MAG: hypothetical protein ACLRFN_04465 [Alphaproteobacteria bacterium]